VSDDLEAARAILLSMGGDPETTPRSEVEMAAHAADLVLRATGDRSIEDMVAALSSEVETMTEVLEHLGILFHSVDADDFTEADQAMLADVIGGGGAYLTTHDVHGYLRVLGRTMATAAEAAVAVHTRNVDPRVDSAVGWVEANAAMAQLGLDLARHMGTMFHHHLRQAIDFQRHSHGGSIRGEVLHLAVCFVDVSGFTSLSAQVSVQAIEEFVDLLEATTATLAIQHGVRLVKMMGDEVMLVGPNASDMGCAALCLVDDLATSGYRARGGVTFGDVAMVHGDYFGPVVNLASRLAGLADPGRLLTDRSGADAIAASTAGCGDVLVVTESDERPIRGLAEPVLTFSVSAAGP
jgi:class 3 adenylate cyclase